jgi:DNA (cytosine-5)-methyltransferase 1
MSYRYIMPDTLRIVDLFAGTGAFTRAFEDTGKVTCVFANDMVAPSKTVYDANFAHPLILGDLNDIDVETIPAHDILTGGFPCQPFSIAGRREGFDDQRSNVFWKILAIIDRHNPRCVILENVKNLVTHDNKNTFTTIRNNLEQRGYHLTFKVLNTSSITGVPQHRERIYIVCLKSPKASELFTLDFETREKSAITPFLEETVPDKYYYKDTSSVWPLVSQAVVKENTVYQYRRVYVRENKSQECPTLTANMGEGGHNVPLIRDKKGIRKLTPRECFSLQGFPASYVLPALADSKLYKLAGNAVSLPVVKLIAERVVPILEQTREA